MSFPRKTLVAAGALVAIGGVGIAATVVGVERSCVSDMAAPAISSDFAITDEGYARSQGDSFLTFPEWYIVHAYNDLAGVTARSSESGFDYLASIRGFWTSLCGATRHASDSGPASADQKATNYIIGFSFTAEMGLMGAYERTIGALTEWTAGGDKTAEDEFNLALLKEYAAFLYQTPWFRFPFGEKLRQFWRETPFVPSIRAVERRGSLSLQYAGRSAYAALMRFVAGYDPADLTIRSVVGGLAPSDLAGDRWRQGDPRGHGREGRARRSGGDGALCRLRRFRQGTGAAPGRVPARGCRQSPHSRHGRRAGGG